jgi:hypothetical protein
MSYTDATITAALSQSLDIELPASASMGDLEIVLAAHINSMITTDMNRLLNLLYRLDIGETRLRAMLERTDTDAGVIVARLIMERQIQKFKARQNFKPTDENEIDETEKW